MVQEIRVRISNLTSISQFRTTLTSPLHLPSTFPPQTLDGEMQKLVYDNYNKFITATETIKEMKNDVYGMDPDMEAVR